MKDYSEILTQLNNEIWSYAETKFQEYRSMAAHTKVLEQEGFSVTNGLADMPTAFIATWGKGKPVIGILAEYDALNGLSQTANATAPCVRTETNNGHGCGHCLLGTAAVGAALMLRDLLEEKKISATVCLVGCPAEEGGSGKTYLARAGIFDMLDIALTWHPAGGNAVITGSMNANCQVRFHFKGISSHAACAPQLGRSALDAVELMDVGANYLREHIESTDRIHYAILDTGGDSPNVVQNHADVLYLIRSSNSSKVKKLYSRIQKIAQGAALMTETEVEMIFEKACSETISNPVLEQILYESMVEEPYPEFTKKEVAYAQKIRSTYDDDTMNSDLCVLGCSGAGKKQYIRQMQQAELVDFIKEHHHEDTNIACSSDVGDCSQVVPTAQFAAACFTPGTPGHSWQMVTQSNSSYAVKVMIWSAKVLARAGLKVALHPEIITAAKQSFAEITEGREYECPIPPEVRPKVICV